jgi:hypothetical protein
MRRALVPSIFIVVAMSAALRANDPRPAPPVPAPDGSLNAWVLDVVREYPTDGTCGYHWPREGSWEGATQDVTWGGRTLSHGDPQRRSYCCGLTYEVFVRALQRAQGGDVPGLDADLMHEARLRFFGDSTQERERKRLVQHALVSLNLGEAVPLEQARAGDFVQLWRHDGGGHQAVFMNWLYERGEIVGLTYWSSQPSTRGIGYRSELVSDAAVDRAQVHVGRAWWPPRR